MKLNHTKKPYLEVHDNEVIGLNAHGLNTPHGVLVNQLGYRHYSTEYKGLIIDRETLDTFFIPVMDFNYVEYFKSKKIFVTYPHVYKHKNYDFFILIDIDLNSADWENEEEDLRDGIYSLYQVYYRTEDQESCNILTNVLNKYVKVKEDSSSKISIVLQSSAGIQLKEHTIKPLPLDINKMYNDDFKEVYDFISDKLINESKGIVLLHGKAGTGKTNLIKHLTTVAKKKKFIFIPVNVIPSLTDPSFIGQLINNKDSVLVLEDCENYIKERQGNSNNVVSTILNLSDGILSDVLGIQIICTFNAKISDVDHALLRKGRLIAEYEFDNLSLEKCKMINDSVSKPMTLAELYNLDIVEYKTLKSNNKIGFN